MSHEIIVNLIANTTTRLRPDAMIGLTIGAWSGRPIEEPLIWVAVSYATVIFGTAGRRTQGPQRLEAGRVWRPLPPIGRHRYVHKLYALDTVLPVLNPATKATLEKAMHGHILAQCELVGSTSLPDRAVSVKRLP